MIINLAVIYGATETWPVIDHSRVGWGYGQGYGGRNLKNVNP